jgi:hypothetical protein
MKSPGILRGADRGSQLIETGGLADPALYPERCGGGTIGINLCIIGVLSLARQATLLVNFPDQDS